MTAPEDDPSNPRTKAMLQRLHAKGLKISLWINPYVAQKSPLFAEGVIRYAMEALGLCASVSGARYTSTTEVYPDSSRATPEQCIAAQVAAVCAALDFVIQDKR